MARAMSLLQAIAEMRDDVANVLAQDPAVRTRVEAWLCYPGLHAVWFHRLAHRFWRAGFTTIARLTSHIARWLTGVEIHPAARIGKRLFIDHGMGVVIGETASVGDDCLLYQGVLLGGTSLERKVRHPQLGNNVVVGAHACILGAIQVGDNARIGSGSVVVKSVPAGETVVGVPARRVGVIHSERPHDHGNLPDPPHASLITLQNELNNLKARIHELESQSSTKGRPFGMPS